MGYTGVVYAKKLLDINVAASGALAVLNPLLLQVDFTLFGSLGIGALMAQLQAQLEASLAISLSLPTFDISATLAAIADLQASLSASLTAPSLNVTADLDFVAQLQLQIGGLEALIQGALAVKIPAVQFAANLAASLSAGPVFALVFESETSPVSLASVGAAIAADFSAGLSKDSAFIAPGEAVYGILLVTKGVSAWAALSATMSIA